MGNRQLRGVEAIRAHLGLHSASTVRSMMKRNQIPTFVEAGKVCSSTDLLAAAVVSRERLALERFNARGAARATEA